jgi:hypothetical protein
VIAIVARDRTNKISPRINHTWGDRPALSNERTEQGSPDRMIRKS